MIFLWPWSLLGLAVVGAVALLSLLRPRRQLAVVGSLSLWRQALDAGPRRASGRVSLSWWLLLAGALGAVCATARPVLRPSAPARRVVVALYPSAELADGPGMADLRDAVGALLDRLDAADSVRLVLPAEAAGPLAWMSPRQARIELADIGAVPVPANDLTFVPPGPTVQHAYHFAPAGADVTAGPAVSVVRIAPSLPVVTIEAVAAEELGSAVQVFAALRNQRDETWAGTVRLDTYSRDGTLIRTGQSHIVSLGPLGRAELVLDSAPAEILAVSIRAAGAKDEQAACVGYLVRRPACTPRIALTGRPEPLLAKYLNAASLECVEASQADVVIACGVDSPPDRPALVIGPAGPPGGYTVAAELNSVMLSQADIAADDPVMRHVDLQPVAVRRVAPWKPIASARAGQKLLVGLRGEALVVRSRRGSSAAPARIYVAFDINTDNTNFAMTDAFVVFLTNAIEYLAPSPGSAARYEYVTPLEAGGRAAGRRKALLIAPGFAAAGPSGGHYPWPGVYADASGPLEAVNLPGLRGGRQTRPASEAVADLPLPEPEPPVASATELWPMLVAAAVLLWLAGWAGGIGRRRALAPATNAPGPLRERR